MQEKYTEDIDKLDTFYQNALQEASVEPPAYLWDKISTASSEDTKPKGFFSKRSTLLLLLLLFTVSVCTVGIFLLKNKNERSPETPVPNKNTEQLLTPTIQDNTNETTPKNEQKIESSDSRQKQRSTTIAVPAKADSLVAPVENKTSVIEEKPAIESPKTIQDTISSPAPVTPKKKVSFREKHKQEINKDSLRPLFIPVK